MRDFEEATFKILLLIILISFLACDKKNDYNQLDIKKLKGSWIFDKFIDKTTGESETLPENHMAGVTFHGDNCINVNGPCNSGPGKYSKNGNKIEITHLAMTERGCNILGFETLFTSNLSGEYDIEDNILTIISNHNKDLVFTRSDTTQLFVCFDL